MESLSNSTAKDLDSSYECDDYQVDISFNHDLALLESQWENIQQSENVTFFLSWAWVSNWIETYSPRLIVITAKQRNKAVAIGLFTQSIEKRHKFISSRQLRLQQTGQHDFDQIWVEYNDFICRSEHQEHAVNACIKVIKKSFSYWDEIIFSMAPSARYQSFIGNGIDTKITLKVPCYSVDLTRIRSDGQQYIDTITANTRYQIRRSIKLYKKHYGEITIEKASSLQAALQLFNEAGEFHKERWGDSGFRNPEFIKFHKNLISNNFTNKSIDLIKVTAGETTIAIMYNLILNNNIYFYLQGLEYQADNKIKPGLVAHSIITQYYLDKGMNLYDYMGGYSQYKTQLASHSTDCYTLCIQRPRIKFKLEKLAQKIKHLAGF